jgi:hypothetical protein
VIAGVGPAAGVMTRVCPTTKQSSAAARCYPPPGKQTLGQAIGGRFRFAAITARAA